MNSIAQVENDLCKSKLAALNNAPSEPPYRHTPNQQPIPQPPNQTPPIKDPPIDPPLMATANKKLARNRIRIGIIGGGLAGLTAAYQLSKKDYLKNVDLKISLLEATGRIGGRVYTLRQFSPGLYAEAGALAIADDEQEMQTLIKELNLELLARPDMLAMKYYDPDEKYIPWLNSRPGALFKKYILNSIQEDLETNDKTLDKISMRSFLEARAKENNDDATTVVQAIEIGFLGTYCDDLSKLSALDGLRYIKHYFHTRNFFSITNGNEELPIALESVLQKNGVAIVKNSPTIKVNRPISENKSSPVTITTINSTTGKTKTFEFDYVIIATPLSALQSTQLYKTKGNYIVFSPPLPSEKRKAIDAINYNHAVARIYYEIDRRFWLDENLEIATLITNHPTVWIESHSTHFSGKKSAIIEIHSSGKRGKSFQNNSDVLTTAKTELSNIWDIDAYLSSTPPIAFFWDKEIYQQGAYPYFGPGQAYYPLLLRKKLPSISFAGEYTSLSSHGTMSGAVRSGYRAANEAKEALS